MVDKKKLRAQFTKDWKKHYNMDFLKSGIYLMSLQSEKEQITQKVILK